MQKNYVFVVLSLLIPMATYSMSLSKYSLASTSLGKRNISEVGQDSVDLNDVQIYKKQKKDLKNIEENSLVVDSIGKYLIGKSVDHSKFIQQGLQPDEELIKLVEKHKSKIAHARKVLKLPRGVPMDLARFNKNSSQMCTLINDPEVMQSKEQEHFENVNNQGLEEIKHEIIELIFPGKIVLFTFVISDEFAYGYKQHIGNQEEKKGYIYLLEHAKFCINCICGKEIYTMASSSDLKNRIRGNFKRHINNPSHSNLTDKFNIEPLNEYLSNHTVVLKKYDK